MTETRRERDGRPARGKTTKAPYQVVRDAAGRVTGYRRQLVDPITKKRLNVTAASPEELLARCDRLSRAKRDARVGLASFDDVAKAVGQATQLKGIPLRDAWRTFTKDGDKGARWRSKLEGYWLRHLAPKLGALHVHELRPEVMVEWAEWMRKKRILDAWGREKPLEASTVHNIFDELRAALRMLVRLGRIRELPWGAWSLRSDDAATQRRRAVGRTRAGVSTPDDLARLMAAAEEHAGRAWARRQELPDLHLRIGVMSMLGLRRGEAIALSWDHLLALPSGALDVHIEYAAPEGWRSELREAPGFSLLDARPMAAPKHGRARHIEIAADGPIARMLASQRRLLERLGLYRYNGPVFPDTSGAFRARDCVRPADIRAVARRAGLEQPGRVWVQHSTRHSAVRLQVASGATLREAQDLAGHASAQTTQVYFEEAGRQAARVRIESAISARVELAPVDASTFTVQRAEGAWADPAEVHKARTRASHEKFLGRKVFVLAEHVDAAAVSTRAVPQVVKDAAHGKYRKAYNEARRQGLTLEECRSAGARAKRGLLAAWAKKVKATRRGEPPPEDSATDQETERRGDAPRLPPPASAPPRRAAGES